VAWKSMPLLSADRRSVKSVMQKKKKTKTFDPVMTVDNYLGYPEDVDK
jgi:hypothetical protein